MARLKALRPKVAALAPRQLAKPIAAPVAYGQGRGGRPWRRLRDQVMKRDDHLCQPCLKNEAIYTEATQVDHVVPCAEGGTDELSNLQAICDACHDTKTKAEAARGVLRAFKGTDRG